MLQTVKTLHEIIDIIKEKGYALNFLIDIPESYQDNIEVIKAIIENGGLDYESLPISAKENKEILKLIIEDNGYYFKKFPEWAKDDEDIVLIAVSNHSNTFEHVSERLRKNRDIVLTALTKEPTFDTIKYVADQELQNDLDILKLAVKGHSQAFEYIPDQWKSNPELIDIILNLKISSSSFKHLPVEYRDNKDIAIKAINDDGGCFEYLTDRLRDDEELAIMAVKVRGRYLEYASDRIKSDKNIVTIAIEEGSDIYSVIETIPEELKNDIELAVIIASVDSRYIQYLSEEVRNNQQVIEACMKERKYFSGECYQYFDSIYKNQRDITVRMSKGSNFPLDETPDEFRNDKEIVLNAVKNNADNFDSIGSILLCDMDFLKELYNHNEGILSYMDEATKEVLFTTTAQSESHNGIIVTYNVVLDNGSVQNQQRTVQKGLVSKNGETILTMDTFPVIVYEEDGPVGSYLSDRYVNNLVALGDFLFFVKTNSGRETFTKNMRENTGWGPAPQTSKDFLNHEVYLIPESSKNLHYEDIDSLPRIYFGLEKHIPKGITIFPTEDSYREALTVLNQEKVHGTPSFEKLDDNSLKVLINNNLHELFGAAFVYVDDLGWRLLIPNADGALKSLEVLKNTNVNDDIEWVKSHNKELTTQQKQLLNSYFDVII
jgi:hypothetical protein